MQVDKRKEIEKKEREQYIEEWIQRNKMKGKKKKATNKDGKVKDLKKSNQIIPKNYNSLVLEKK